MFANVHGKEGVVRAIQMLKREIATCAVALRMGGLKGMDYTYVS
tara:strand:+ start:2306 stop:2437 length:132 start_codon:yes stop_codon:yes gene_type:complete